MVHQQDVVMNCLLVNESMMVSFVLVVGNFYFLVMDGAIFLIFDVTSMSMPPLSTPVNMMKK